MKNVPGSTLTGLNIMNAIVIEVFYYNLGCKAYNQRLQQDLLKKLEETKLVNQLLKTEDFMAYRMDSKDHMG